MAALAALLPAAATVPAALGATNPDPGIIRVEPAPGEVVTAGLVELTGVLATSSSVSEVSLVVDGEEHDVRLAALDGNNRRFAAEIEVSVGQHIATVRFANAEGRSTQRSWRFAAVAVALHRLAGNDRVSTAAALSRYGFPQEQSATGAVITTSQDFPDGLAAAPLAVHLGGPLLLSAPEELSPATAAELVRAVAPGSQVVLLGGTRALSARVATDIADLGFEVARVAGADRAATAAAIAQRLPSAATVFITSSRGFADGLAAGAPAARDGTPILLTDSDELSGPTRQVLVDRATERVVIVGGVAAVGAGVEQAIRELVPDVDRIAGADRYATATAIVDAFFPAGDLPTVAVASGAAFPDALAGGPLAGALGIPLLLAPPGELPNAQLAQITARHPSDILLYGGPGALDPSIEGQLRNTILDDPDAPVTTQRTPAPGAVLNSLDTVELGLDRGVDLNHSTLYVTVDGLELHGVTTQGDFNDRLVFQAAELPFDPQPDVDYPVEVFAQAYDGQHWRHVSWRFTYRKVDLGRGDAGQEVLAIQQRLTALGYWLGDNDGNFGALTTQALMAFQKYEGLERSGVADAITRGRLELAARPVPSAARNGRWVEIDKTRQVMLFVLDGVVEWTMNTSTGTEGPFTRPDGSTGVAHTPEGWFTFFRQIDGLREAELGQMWRPKYFTSAGHAIHGSTSIPAYPASHGCARLSYPAIDFVWAADLAPIGTPLLVHV